ncbi:cytochrome c [Paraburkholderia bannensis]|jgi:cytochrome c|uniref:Cytochrome c n=1 Tax=Paraburkholderia bannensis TaxID=765414 RepID=A0A7W9TYX1_9BURK|nr:MULTISPECIES: c-type cytochrome [Paraburkholderia]MBB3258913.1 cytochrome c [Paraburkholderia sp. WP4_3_2]MBB6103927.1 cytochrome c [Paraburkholderia bannensis]
MKLKSQAKNKTATPAAPLARSIAALAALALSCTFAAPAAHAQGGPGSTPGGLALAQQQNCMSCHSVTRTFMGPALRDVASKYAARPEAQTYLAHKIMEGSAGVWGMVPMPANTQLSPGQAAMLASWILTLK